MRIRFPAALAAAMTLVMLGGAGLGPAPAYAASDDQTAATAKRHEKRAKAPRVRHAKPARHKARLSGRF